MKRTKTTPYDWALVQWARACEESKVVDLAKVEPTLDAEKDERGRLADPLAYLASRASKVLESLGLSGRRQVERSVVVWIASAAIVVALGAIVFPLARVDRLLDGDVNLAGPFVFFILGQLFFLGWSIVLLGALAFQSVKRRILKEDRPETIGEKALAALSSVIGTIVLFCLRRVAPIFYAMFGRKGTERFAWRRRDVKSDASSQKKAEPYQKGSALFWDALFSKPRFIFFWGGFLSHLFWTSCSLCVLVVLGARMQGNQYDYCWRTSLEDETTVKRAVDLLGAPASILGFNTPDDADVSRLFKPRGVSSDDDAKTPNALEQSVQAPESTATVKTAADTRKRWSYFLLGIVFFWCVVPRFVLTIVYHVMFKRALRDYRPNLDDPYFVRLVSEAESYQTTTSSSFVDDPIEIDSLRSKDVEPPKVEPSPTQPAPEPSAPSAIQSEARATSEPLAPQPSASQETPSESTAVQEEAETSVDAEPTTIAPLNAQVVEPQSHVEAAAQENAPEEPAAELALESDSATPSAHEPDPCAKEESIAPEPAPERVEIIEPAVPCAPPRPTRTVAFRYDADLDEDRWRALLPLDPPPEIFGDAAGDFACKKALKSYLESRGSEVALCAFVTDVGLSPARHYIKFMRETVLPSIPNAKVYVVLSGGEKLRVKYGAQTNAVAERLEDWSNALRALAKGSGVTIYPVFYYDAQLDLPEQRARLRDLLRSGGDPNETCESRPRDYAKWDAATRRVLSECRVIFSATEFQFDEESERRRAAQVCADLFEIYREETDLATASGVGLLSAKLGQTSLLEKARSAADAAKSALAGNGTSVTDALIERCKESGYGKDFVEQRLMNACGLSEKMRGFCAKLSPKCAIATASVGLTIPALVAFAPLLGGAATATAVASAFGALGTLLPTSVASGVAAGALGAVAPMSLSACKKKIAEKLGSVLRMRSAENASETSSEEALESSANLDLALAQAESAAALACVTTTWRVVLELQGRPEDEIVDLTPQILAPLEESNLDSLDAIERAFADARALLPSER